MRAGEIVKKAGGLNGCSSVAPAPGSAGAQCYASLCRKHCVTNAPTDTLTKVFYFEKVSYFGVTNFDSLTPFPISVA